MAITAISPARYGKVLARALPRVIETREEFDRHVSLMEELDRRIESGKDLSPEERALLALLEHLVKEYDDRVEIPKVAPVKILEHLMDHRGLRQIDSCRYLGLVPWHLRFCRATAI